MYKKILSRSFAGRQEMLLERAHCLLRFATVQLLYPRGRHGLGVPAQRCLCDLYRHTSSAAYQELVFLRQIQSLSEVVECLHRVWQNRYELNNYTKESSEHFSF